MDRQEPGVDQRQQLLKRNKRGRTPAEWEEIALKVMLLHSEWAAWVRDNYSWKMHGRVIELKRQIIQIMGTLNMHNTCQPSTFINAVAKSLRNLKREARDKTKQERYREYRDKQRGSK
jgi:hypothetical protein